MNTTALTVPAVELAPIVALVVNGLTSEHSRRAQAKALTDLLTWYDGQGRPTLNKAAVQAYK